MNVLLDPSAAIACYYLRRGNTTIIFSHLEDIIDLIDDAFQIDEDYLYAILGYDKIITETTGIKDIYELFAGQKLIATPSELERSTVWDPRASARKLHQYTDPKVYAEDMADTVRYVVKSQAATYPQITINLSGGLDSSIVLACAAALAPHTKVNALHYVLGAGDPTEYRYAQLVADQHGIELFRIDLPPDASLPSIDSHPRSARPSRQFLGSRFASRVREQCDAVGAAIFTGQGGDHLFLETRSTGIFADHIYENGLTRSTLPTLLDAASLAGQSIWKVLGASIGTLIQGQKSSHMATHIARRRSQNSALLVQRAFKALRMPDWIESTSSLPPLKSDQVSELMHLLRIQPNFDDWHETEVVHPLVSLPLIEFCLATPTYALCRGGSSRGLVKEAFYSKIPDQIRLRTVKGDASRYVTAQFEHQKSAILEALVEGELARRNLIDPRRIEECIRSGAYKTQRFSSTLRMFYAAEAWTRAWSSRP